ncbi:MAG: hypothetical protein RL129_204, partial [Actinomycetota bacterium]
VGIIRTKKELEDAVNKIADIRKRISNVKVEGGRDFNPGFHLAFDLDNMLLVAESTAKSAVIREESHQEPLPELRKDLFQLFDIHELEKYMTPEELAKGGA